MVACGRASTTTAALFPREQTGQGQYLSISLLQAALAMQSQRMIWVEGEARDLGRDMRSGGVTGIYATQSGYIDISANTPHFWSALCAMLGLEEFAANPKCDTIRKRAQHAAEILAKVRAAFLTRTALDWEARLGESVPCSAIRSIEEMFDHPQVLSNGLVQDFAHPKVGHYRGFAQPIAWDRAPQPAPLAAPLLGEHTQSILRECSYSAAEIDALV
ncbi:MAG TPA: CoA transferase [Terriglobales bacterium]|nr:CoA transferase [Terriglobales bacterium]